MRPRKCHDCPAKIVLLRTEGGGYHPVDFATVSSTEERFQPHRGHRSHFDTCPKSRKVEKPNPAKSRSFFGPK